MVKELDQQTQQKILSAARTVIIRHGKSGARMQDIADEAGVNKALLHYYFRSKDKIYRAVLDEVVQDLFSTLLESIDLEDPFERMLKNFIREHIGAIQKHQALFQFFFAEVWTNKEELVPLIREMMQTNRGLIPELFFARINKAVYQKEIRAVDPFHFLMNLLSLDIFFFIFSPMFFDLVQMPEEQQQKVTDERAGQVFDFIWNSIRPEEAPQ